MPVSNEEDRLLSVKIQILLNLFMEYQHDVSETYLLNGEIWKKKDLECLYYLFQVTNAVADGFTLTLKFEQQDFYKLLLKSSLAKLIGCSTMIATPMFWSIKKMWREGAVHYWEVK